MKSNAGLEPAHRVFVANNLPGFSDDRWSVTLAGSAASQRTFLRLAEKTGEDRSFILVLWNSGDEDWPRFLSIPAELAGRIPFLPKVHAADPALGLILEEDLGECTLKRCILDAPCNRILLSKAYRQTLDTLAVWQSLDLASSPTIASRAMDTATFVWESGYFAAHCVAGLCGLGSLLDAAWEAERRRLAEAAARLPRTFLHRDFQSENIMFHHGQVRFVDFQGARLGPPAYDVASLLFDPYIPALDDASIDELFGYYASLPRSAGSDIHDLYLCAAQRLMQALGAYGNLTINKGKPRYREFVPVAVGRLQRVMAMLPEYGVMGQVAEACAAVVGNKSFLPIR